MKKITNLEIGTLTFFLMRAFFVGICFNSLIHIAYQDSYISILLGIIIGIIPLLCFYYLFNYEPSLNIFDKFKHLFGKKIGNIVNIILIIFTFFLSILSFLNMITIIYKEYLDKTPSIIISLMFGIGILYALYKGINTILRTSIIFFIISSLICLFSIIGLIFKIDLNNFKPVGIHNYYNGSFSYLAYNVLPLFLLLLIPKNKIVNNYKTHKHILIFYFIASISIIMTILAILGNFGIKLSLLYDYPEFEVLKYVYVSGISSRLDSILFIQWIFDMFIFITYSIHFTTRGIISIVKIKKNIIYIIFTIILILINNKLITIFLINNQATYLISIIIFSTLTLILIISMVALLFKKEIISTS